MIRFLVCGCIITLLLSCNANDQKTASATDNGLPKTLEPFADSMVRLNKYALESINVAAGYYSRLVPADSLLADSAAVLFLRHITSVVDTTNQKLYQDTTNYFDLIYNQSKNAPQKQKDFQQHLANHHVIIQADGEGGVYSVADYDWVSRILQSKTSGAVDSFLTLLAKEEKNPTLLDAGIAIEMQELADRLVSTEMLLNQKLPKSFLEDVMHKNKFYLGTLLFGSANSPALEYTEVKLTDEFKKGYEYLQKTYPTSNAAQLVKEWQTIVQAKDNEKMDQWGTKYHPYE